MLEIYSLATMAVIVLVSSIAELIMFKDKLTKKEILFYILYYAYALILVICFLIIVSPEFFDSKKISKLDPFSVIYGAYFLLLIFLNMSLSLLTPLSSLLPNTIIDMFRKKKTLCVRVTRIKHIFVYILLINVIVWGLFIYVIQKLKA